jgi:secreted trypsin-like serine protease
VILKAKFYLKKKHPSYSSTTLQNDIAMLYLSAAVTLNSYIQIACLPTTTSTSYPGVGVSVYAAGWGVTSTYATSYPNVLQNVKLTTYSASTCPYQYFFNSGMICAGLYSFLLGDDEMCRKFLVK